MKRRFLKPALLAIVVLAIIGAAVWGFSRNKTTTAGAVTTTQKGDVKSQKITLNQTFDMPVPGAAASIQPLKVTFQTSQLTNRISISGKARTAKKGTQYLMLNVLVENSNTKGINFRTKDIVRLIDPNNKKFAPSLANKTLVIDADAVKKDVVGFVVPDSFKEFKIQYGLPEGEKKILDLKFK